MNQIDFNGLNNYRIKVKKVSNIFLYSFLLISLIISFLILKPFLIEILTKSFPLSRIILFFILFILIVYVTFNILDHLFVRPFERIFYSKYKKLVFKEYLLNSIRENFIIDTKTSFFENYIKVWKGQGDLSDSQLFVKYTHFNLDERFEGKIDELKFAISKINLEWKISVYNGNAGYFNYKNVFDGFHFKINYDLNPNLTIEFTNKNNEFFISSALKKIKGQHLNSTSHNYLDDNYEIYCSDKNLMLKLITNEFIDGLMSLNSIIGDKVIFKIKGGFVYVAFNDPNKYFEIDYNLEVKEICLEHSEQLNNLFNKLNEIKKFIDFYLVNKSKTSSYHNNNLAN
jgi:hypothetical protein